jgi:hypothetical protein
MTLPTQTWRNVGRATYSPGTVEGLLNALYALGTASTYADGSSRTPGSGAAGTWSRFQNGSTTEAVYCTPAVTALNARLIYAGVQTGSPTPTMAFSESFAAAALLSGVAKNAGNFASWDASSPFTSGEFSGYCPSWGTNDGAGTVYLYECQEAAYIVLSRPGSSQARHICSGAFVDPGSSNNADAESDGRLYGMFTSGNQTTAVVNVTGAITSSAWMVHSGTAKAGKFFVFEPDGSVLWTLERNITNNTITSYTGRLHSGKYLSTASKIPVIRSTTPDYLVGALRDMAFFGRGSQGQQLASRGTVVGHLICESTVSELESAILFRNA